MAEIEDRRALEKEASGQVRYWEAELNAATKAEKDYRENAERLLKKYSGEDGGEFNLLWANTETLKPAVYSRTAKPDVRRRWRDSKNNVARDAGLILERAIAYSCEVYDFDREIEKVRDTMLITGRGVARVEYTEESEDYTEAVQQIDPLTGMLSIQEVEGTRIINQELRIKAIDYRDFRMSQAKCWEDVRFVAYRHLPTREELERQFGAELARKVPLTHCMLDGDDSKMDDVFKRAEVWEIWDKDRRKQVWMATGVKDILAEDDDPYGLKDFFPSPCPLYSFMVPGCMMPRAEYTIYEKQAKIVNKTSVRIDKLTEELKAAGLYSAVNAEIGKLIRARDGEMIPVQGIDPGAKIADMIAYWPVEQIAKVLASLYDARERAIQVIYQVTGISDIVRGATQASESATAQQLKGNFADLRLQPRRQPMQRMIRDLFRMKAEIIAERYEPAILQDMTGMDVTEDVYLLLRNEKTRNYQIDVESDSTVATDQDAEKQRRIEFLTAVSGFIEKLAPMVQMGAIPRETAKALLAFGVRGFSVGRELEDAIEAIGTEPPQPQQPQPQGIDPVQADMQKHEQELQVDMLKHEKELAVKAQMAAADRQAKMMQPQVM